MLALVRMYWVSAVGVLMTALLVAFAAFFISSRSEVVYTAEARLVVTAGLGLTTGGRDAIVEAPRVGQTYAVLATTRPVLFDLIARTGVPYRPDELAARLSVTANPDTPYLTISITDQDPGRAAAIANALAAVLVERSTVPPTSTEPATQLLASVETAIVPQDPSGPRVLYNTALAGVATLVAGLVVVAAVRQFRPDEPKPGWSRST